MMADAPAGWTVSPLLAGYQLQTSFPNPGYYTFPITLHVGSSVNYGAEIKPRFVDSVSSGSNSLADKTVTVEYPVPTITSVNPDSPNEGADIKLTILGIGFGLGSVVQWNGDALTTQFVNRTTLTATLPRDLAEGSITSVTVFNPAPAGTSNTLSYSINNVNPVGSIPDRYVVYSGSGTVGVTGGFIANYDPSLADTARGLHYYFSATPAGLVNSYAGAGTIPTYPVSVTAVGTTSPARVFDRDNGFTQYTAKVYAIASNAATRAEHARTTSPTLTRQQRQCWRSRVGPDRREVHGLGCYLQAGHRGDWVDWHSRHLAVQRRRRNLLDQLRCGVRCGCHVGWRDPDRPRARAPSGYAGRHDCDDHFSGLGPNRWPHHWNDGRERSVEWWLDCIQQRGSHGVSHGHRKSTTTQSTVRPTTLSA